MSGKGSQHIMYRIYAITGVLVLFSFGILYRLITVQFVEKQALEQSVLNQNRKIETLEDKRGNVYAVDGALLATSVPSYNVYFDPTVPSQAEF